MTAPTDTEIGRLRQRLGVAAYGIVVAGLLTGIALHLLQQVPLSVVVLAATCALLIALPVVTVIGVLADEVRRRDWGFALLAAAVLALLAYALAAHV